MLQGFRFAALVRIRRWFLVDLLEHLAQLALELRRHALSQLALPEPDPHVIDANPPRRPPLRGQGRTRRHEPRQRTTVDLVHGARRRRLLLEAHRMLIDCRTCIAAPPKRYISRAVA